MPLRDYNAAVDFVDRNVAEGRGGKIAFIDPQRSLSYGELCDAVARVGPMLARLGVEQENRIALVLKDTVDFPILFWGAIRAGIVPVLLNTRLNADQYRYLLEDSRSKVVFASSEFLPAIEEAAADLPHLRTVVTVDDASPSTLQLAELLAAEDEGGAPAATCADDIAYWQYSSGTTGMPKGVMHVHSSPRIMAENAGRRIGYREDDVVFSAAKLFFAYGLGNAMFCTMGIGATSVLYPERPTADSVFDTLQAHQPTMLFAVPTLYAAMLADPRSCTEALPDRLRLCVSAGEPLPAQVGLNWRNRFGRDIVNGVGSTEMGHLFLTNLPHAVEYGTSGVPVDGYRLRLVDESGDDVADGEIGELLVNGRSAAAGYWNQRDKTRTTFVGEWTRTGDKYHRRADGVYTYCGRTDDIFKVSGIWVSPFEIEQALMSHPKVLEAAVIPAEDVDGLVKPKAFVVLSCCAEVDPGTLFEELKDHVKSAIGPWKYPRWIQIMDDLPKTSSGKLQRYLLREMTLGGVDATENTRADRVVYGRAAAGSGR
ncbi:benzoate-CoA ligase family protein [Rhodopseudomonas palustris]|uniref:benzoate-CoA ligase family protein n=1 Tax=Rhodopseudomonas palustris TaxID=1076 RepID=UPI0021F30B8C|nr:benzoate-CoA ligase family protein [Rhodopseudomonas palustris]UYO54490.1 benzoate-CoA ligase family protein [Rhodopseudomonas palustris]